MPLYDYECSEHGEVKDVFAKFDETVKCEKCGKEMKRLISGFSNVGVPKTGLEKRWRGKGENYSVALGKHIESKEHYKEELKKIGADAEAVMEHPY